MYNKTRTLSAASFMPQEAAVLNVLHARAKEMAKPPIERSDTTHSVQYLRFKLGPKEFYGIPYQYTKEVMRYVRIAKLPDVPHFIAGVINRRGSFISVLNLSLLFGVEMNSPSAEEDYIIVVSSHDMTVGVLAEGIAGSDIYDFSDLDAALPSQGIIKPEYILGLHKGKTTIINIEAVMSDPILQTKKETA